MRIVRSVLLVHDEPDGFCGLETMLHAQRVRTLRARDHTEAESVLRDMEPIDLVLTAAVLPAGTWRDTLHAVSRAAKRAPLIVVSPVMSVPLYLDTQDAGAVDFIVLPVTARDLAFVLRVALNRAGSGIAPAPGQRASTGLPVAGTLSEGYSGEAVAGADRLAPAEERQD